MALKTKATGVAFLLATAQSLSAADIPAGRPLRGAAMSRCDAKVATPGSLRVVLTDQQKGPLPGATVTLVDPRAGELIVKGVSGQDGSATFTSLEGKGLYAVGALIGFHADGAEVYVAQGCEVTLELTLPIAPIICDVEVTAERPVPDPRQP